METKKLSKKDLPAMQDDTFGKTFNGSHWRQITAEEVEKGKIHIGGNDWREPNLSEKKFMDQFAD